ncbi:MAG: FHA domain-containing protein [Clostridium sp.]|nr:FHA domain-containing protein [Clostridium sp.]
MKENKKKSGLLNIVDNLLWAGIGALIVIVLYLDTTTVMKAIFLGIIVVFASIYMWFVYYKATSEMVVAAPVKESKQTEDRSKIHKLCLLNDEHQILKQWELTGKAGLVIGKNTANNQVDVDLGDTALSALISEEHAVLNYTGNSWYVEDFDSEQGTAVQKFLQTDINYLNKSEPVKLEMGDMIYIGKSILQVK